MADETKTAMAWIAAVMGASLAVTATGIGLAGWEFRGVAEIIPFLPASASGLLALAWVIPGEIEIPGQAGAFAALVPNLAIGAALALL